MKVLFYSSESDAPEMAIGAGLRGFVPDENLEVYRSIEELAQMLHRLYDYNTIAILQARDREELLRIISLRELLQGMRVILLIPDQEEETISMAHSLRPRFLSTGKSGFSDIMNVLRKMLGYEQQWFS